MANTLMIRPFAPIVVVGASAGGVEALLTLAAQLPANFAAPILVTLHIDAYDGQMPKLMTRRGPLRATYATAGSDLRAGQIYFAPPDHHLLVNGETVQLTQGSKENHARPAIDPFFRSAALTRPSGSVIGVVLSGMLDDGATGLKLIKDYGGTTIVQDPDEAYASSMPLAALRAAAVDHCVRIAELGSLLTRLVESPRHPAMTRRSTSAEVELALDLQQGDAFASLNAIGTSSSLTCPDCGGSLWELAERPPRRFRCHTGHAYTLRALEHAQSELASTSLWSTLRTLNENIACCASSRKATSRSVTTARPTRLEDWPVR